MSKKLPNFIIIGAGKCGTTSLHNYLDQHPEIYISPVKETNFFLNENIKQKLKPWGVIETLEEYYSLFESASASQILGEISTNYYAYSDSAQLIFNALPNVKIIAILRNPADRAFSSYQMFVRYGTEKRTFEEVMSPEIKYVKRGFYYSELLPFYQVFPTENIKILFFDDLVKNPNFFLQDFFLFIGVDPNFAPDMSKKGREGGLPKNYILHQLLTQDNPIRMFARNILRKLLPLEKRQNIRNSLVKNNIEKVKLSPENREKLINIYRQDILKLQDLVNRDLSNWLK